MMLPHLARKLAPILAIITLTLGAPGPIAGAETQPPPCDPTKLIATSAVVQGATGSLAGSFYVSGSRAMPACTLQGTPTVQILDGRYNTLAITQVAAPAPYDSPTAIVLGGTSYTTATVFIQWRNFCQTPVPPAPYMLRIAPSGGAALLFNPPLTTQDAKGYPTNAGAPRCDDASQPSTLAVGAFQTLAPSSPHDNRYFGQTGFRIDDDTIWDYFNRRGGLSTFGYPVSRTFTLQGFRVQFFQRRIVQLDEQGHARLLNLLDSGLMPYTSFNGASFPGIDPTLVASAPDPSNAAAVLDFVRAHAPDRFQGKGVSFYQTFVNTVTYPVAFPNGGDPALLPGLDLEMWGVPTSSPQYDPNNRNFIYLRFQRGIMHYDATCDCTQGILLADYLKSILTGENLPADLDAVAKSSPYYRQYDPTAPGWVHNATLLPDTNLTDAFTKQ